MHTREQTAAQAVNSLAGKPTVLSLRERFRSVALWKKAFKDVGLWFIFGWLITTMLSHYAPGYPIVVGTASITPGIYWLDRTAFAYTVDSYVSFAFKPAQPWLKARYGDNRQFTKMVKGVEGDTIYADADLQLKVCHALAYGETVPRCEAIGQALLTDTKGRPMVPWVPANHQYTLRTGEVWAYAPSTLSLDSRYYGPILTEAISGKAAPLITWH